MIVATDIDGTLLDEQLLLRPDVRETYCALRDAGILVVPATGRNIKVIKEAFHKITDDHKFLQNMSWYPGVYNHGAVVYGSSADEVIYQLSLPAELVRALVEDVIYKFRDDRQYNPTSGFYTVSLYDCIAFSIDHNSQAFHHVINDPYEEWQMTVVGEDFDKVKGRAIYEGITHVSVSCPHEVALALIEEFDRMCEKNELLRKLRPVFAEPEQVHFLQTDLDKSVGLKKLCEHFGWQQEDIIAIGDGENDREMLSWAGCGIAMGNAAENVKKLAKYIAQRNSEGGWCEAMRQHALAPNAS